MSLEQLTTHITSNSLAYAIAGGIAISGSLLILSTSDSPATLAKKAHVKLAPGPHPDPLIGHLRYFPKQGWYETFTSWYQRYGDIIYLNLAGMSVIVLNSMRAAEELMVKRMSVSSRRSDRTMINELMYGAWGLTALQPGPNFTHQRRLFHKVFGPQAVRDHDSLIHHEVGPFVKALSGVVGDPFQTIMRAVGAIIIKLGYGEKIYHEHGELLAQLNRDRSTAITSAMQKFWLVDRFPFLKHIPLWFPGATFRRVGEEGKHLGMQVRMLAYDLITKDIDEYKAEDSLITRNLNDTGCPNEDLRDAVASMYAAGTDTTSTSVINFFYSMLAYPAVQERIHAELDAALPDGRIPTMDDIQNLTYFQAVWKESIRCNPPVPIALPHVYTKPDVWNGYYIPQGTMFLCNLGFMLKDTRIWGEDSAVFNPERFLPEHNPRSHELPDMMSIPFGFGKRICPGRYLAERVSMQFIAAALMEYTVAPVDGETVPDNLLFDDSVIRRPNNFRCQFKRRRE